MTMKRKLGNILKNMNIQCYIPMPRNIICHIIIADDFSITNQLLDLRARLHALALTMKKHLFISKNQKSR